MMVTGQYESRQTRRAAMRALAKEQDARKRSEAKYSVHIRTKVRQQRVAEKAVLLGEPRGRVIPLVNVIGRGGSRIMRQLIGDKLYRMG